MIYKILGTYAWTEVVSHNQRLNVEIEADNEEDAVEEALQSCVHWGEGEWLDGDESDLVATPLGEEDESLGTYRLMQKLGVPTLFEIPGDPS